MILLRDVPLEKRAEFLIKSIRAYPDSPEFDQAVRDYAQASGIDIAGGLRAFHDLMRRIYADVAVRRGSGRSGQVSGAHCLDGVSVRSLCPWRELVCDHDRYSVVIDKETLKQQYKRGGFDQRQRHLERHGLSLRYLSGQSECKSVSKASHLALAYDGHPGLVPAVHYFAGSIASIPQGKLDQLNKLSMFLKGEYETAILHQPIPRDAFDPFRKDLLDTIDAYREEWLGLVDRFLHQCGLECSGFWAYYGGPAWGVSFAARGKRPLAIFTLGPDILFIEFTLPPSAAEAIIRERRSYSDPIRKGIESFGCAQVSEKVQGEQSHQGLTAFGCARDAPRPGESIPPCRHPRLSVDSLDDRPDLLIPEAIACPGVPLLPRAGGLGLRGPPQAVNALITKGRGHPA